MSLQALFPSFFEFQLKNIVSFHFFILYELLQCATKKSGHPNFYMFILIKLVINTSAVVSYKRMVFFVSLGGPARTVALKRTGFKAFSGKPQKRVLSPESSITS